MFAPLNKFSFPNTWSKLNNIKKNLMSKKIRQGWFNDMRSVFEEFVFLVK